MPTLRPVPQARREPLSVVPADRAREPGPASRYPQQDSATAELLARSQPWQKRGTLYFLVGLLAAIFAFISLVRLDRVVTAKGRLVPIEGALTVQPLDKAIISRVLVAVGDRVRKGQVLATCDPTFAQADLLSLRQKVASLTAHLKRVQAEATGLPYEPPDNDSYASVEAILWRQRQTEFQASVKDFDQRIGADRAQITGLRQNIEDYRSRLKISHEIQTMYSNTAPKGYVSRLQLLTAQDNELEINRNLGESENNLNVLLHTLASLEAQRKVLMDKWREDVLADQVTTQTSLDSAEQDLVKARKLSELVNLVAPEDAVVVSVPKLSTNGVATDAEPLFSLVPLNARLEADVQIDAQNIGFVRIGDPASIKFEAYKFLEHGIGEGLVKTIGQDALTESTDQDALAKSPDDKSRAPYYDTRITITALKLHDVPADTRLIAGMTVTVDVVVGRRTILWYLLGGALRSGAEAMREP